MHLDVSILEIMNKKVVSVNPSQKLIDVKHIFEKRNFHHHIPVTEQGMLVGMISLIDFMYAIKEASMDDDDETYHSLTVKNIMRKSPFSMQSSSTLREVAKELSKGDVHSIMIADENKLKGIVSTADVIQYFLKQ